MLVFNGVNFIFKYVMSWFIFKFALVALKKTQEIMLGKHGVIINSAKNYLAYKIHSFDIAINNNQYNQLPSVL